MSRPTSQRRHRLGACALLAAIGVLWSTSTAAALPPGGAGPDTPGTSATVTPTTLEAGSTIRFTVTGFPAGETVYVKIDDGQGYADDTVQGAGVVYAQAVPRSGTASGSFDLPAFVTPGAHWLRFLASEEFVDAQGNRGVNGYTARSRTFTVVAAHASHPSDQAPGAPAKTTPHATPRTTTPATGSRTPNPASTRSSTVGSAGSAGTGVAPAPSTAPRPLSPTPHPGPSTSASPTTPSPTHVAVGRTPAPTTVAERPAAPQAANDPAGPPVAAQGVPVGARRFPVVGTAALALAVAFLAAAVVLVRRRFRPAALATATATDAPGPQPGRAE